MTAFLSSYEKLDSNVYHSGLIVPEAIAISFEENGSKRVICNVGELSWHAGILPKGKAEWFIIMNADKQKKLGLAFGDEIEVQLVKDNSKYGMEIPEAFTEMLHQEPEAEKYFDALTDGKKRNLIYLVAKVKSANKQIEKAHVIAQHLKKWNGKLDFKQLNLEMKSLNQKC